MDVDSDEWRSEEPQRLVAVLWNHFPEHLKYARSENAFDFFTPEGARIRGRHYADTICFDDGGYRFGLTTDVGGDDIFTIEIRLRAEDPSILGPLVFLSIGDEVKEFSKERYAAFKLEYFGSQ